MKSKLKFSLTSDNQPCIRFEITRDDDDLRDEVARRFFEALGFTSNTLVVFFECDPVRSHEPNQPRYEGFILPVKDFIITDNQLGIVADEDAILTENDLAHINEFSK